MNIIVIGGSFTGCLAAEILTRHFDKVTLIEKADFSSAPLNRKNVPQENHAHVILMKGMNLLKKIYPNILLDLKKHNAPYVNFGLGIDWFQYNEWKKKYKSRYGSFFFSRNLLDYIIREKVKNNNKITILDNTRVEEFIIHLRKNEKIITGLHINENGNMKTIPADLVIDCSGFGSKTPEMLQKAGIDKPVITQVRKDLGYASRIYQALPRDEKKSIVIWSSDTKKNTIGLLLPIENNRYMVSVGGCFSECPKPEEESYLSFMKNLPSDRLFNFVSKLKPLSDVYGFKYPGSTWYHYDKIKNLPDGLIIIGAALCGINPFFGQGITLCTKQLEIIDQTIDDWKNGKINTLSIQKKFNKTITTSWLMAQVEDYRHNKLKEKVTPLIKFYQWYGKKFAILANKKPFAREVQLETIHMLSPPIKIFHPRIIFGMLMSQWVEQNRMKK